MKPKAVCLKAIMIILITIIGIGMGINYMNKDFYDGIDEFVKNTPLTIEKIEKIFGAKLIKERTYAEENTNNWRLEDRLFYGVEIYNISVRETRGKPFLVFRVNSDPCIALEPFLKRYPQLERDEEMSGDKIFEYYETVVNNTRISVKYESPHNCVTGFIFKDINPN